MIFDGQQTRKHAQTHYNRHALNVLLNCYFIMRDNKVDTISTEQLMEKMFFGYKSLAIHLNYLSRRRKLIEIEGNLETPENISIKLTKNGKAFVNLLRDVKYQTLYNANPQKRSNGKKPEKHTQTFFNRHSLNILLQIYLKMRENETREMKVSELTDFIPFSLDSIKIHLKYLTRNNEDNKRFSLLNYTNDEISEDSTLSFTDFGIITINLLRDVKYQSLYNIGTRKTSNKNKDENTVEEKNTGSFFSKLNLF